MPDNVAVENEDSKASSLSRGDNEVPPMALGEKGYNSLFTVGGEVLEEYKWELRWPHLIHTLKEMSNDATIAPAISLVETQISRVGWTVKVPKGYEDDPDLRAKAKFIEECMGDMEHSWNDFINQCVSFVSLGFSIHEKVFRYRRKDRGSKYDDGLIGIKKLPIRAQDSIIGFEWKNKGRDIAGVWQKVIIPKGVDGAKDFDGNDVSKDRVFINRDKFLLFRTGTKKDNPYGTSPLISAWKAWKYKTSLEEHEMIGVAQDLRGMKVIYVHPKYLDPNAAPEDKAVGDYYRRIVTSLHNGEQSGVLLPSLRDENGNRVFEFDVVSVMGQKAHDVNSIISRYNTQILTALTADFLILGQSGGGSFALSESKITISEIAIKSKLREIQDVLNTDLIPQLFALNGWDTKVLPYFEHDPIEQKDIDTLSKAIQRTGAIGMLPLTPDSVNWVCDQIGMPTQFKSDMDRDEFVTMLTKSTSRSGDGMEDAGPGTSKGGDGGEDNSVSNNEN